MKVIILASNSSRRKEILENLGIDFRVISSNIDERIDKQLSPTEIAEHFAYLKAKNVSGKLNGPYIVIGADTVVECDGILGKPQNEQDAYRMLKLLSGRVHRVITGFAIIDCLTDQQFIDHESTKVYFKKLGDKEIQSYIATDEYIDKAGAYGIQGKASLFIEKIEGDYFNVVGLPVFRLNMALYNNFNISFL
ncbi:MAG: Maf family protein [Candidatus Alkaliphilus sp. MAG34]|nr:septum formation protein Maf [Clostridiales bacterium]